MRTLQSLTATRRTFLKVGAADLARNVRRGARVPGGTFPKASFESQRIVARTSRLETCSTGPGPAAILFAAGVLLYLSAAAAAQDKVILQRSSFWGRVAV